MKRVLPIALLLGLAAACAWGQDRAASLARTIDQYLKFAKTGPIAQRTNALNALVQLGPDAARAVPALIQLLDDPEEPIRFDAAVVLATIGPAAAPAKAKLVAMLGDTPLVKTGAAAGLGGIGPAAEDTVPALLALVREDDVNVRQQAALSLCRIGKPLARILPALSFLLKDEQEAVRTRAALGLSLLGPDARPAGPALRARLKDRCEDCRWSAAIAIASIAPAEAADLLPELAAALKGHNPEVVLGAIRQLAKMGQPAGPALEDAARNQGIPELRREAEKALKQIWQGEK